MTKVDIGVATYGYTSHEWWSNVMVNLLSEQSEQLQIGRIHAIASALPDHNKNYIIDDRKGVGSAEQKDRNERTDANKSTIVGASANGSLRQAGFLSGDADWIFFMDDDTVPPKGALTQLVSLGREFVGGLYFLAKPPHNPIAYYRGENGLYMALWNYPHGALTQVDSIGMGCTLVHRSVYEKIMDAYELFQRPNGSVLPILRSDVHGHNGPRPQRTEVREGVLHMPVYSLDPEDKRPWPFYAMEYGRTEDHHFCELSGGIGIRPWLDTTIICDHYKLKAVNRVAHQMMVEAMPVDYGEERANELSR
ncbi:MAG: glycosyltransferase family 2 protein [Anaerolineales bacterium]